MGKPEDEAVEFSKDMLVKVVGASGEQANPRFEFLDRLITDGDPAFGEVKAEEVKPFDKVNHLCLGWRKGETQLAAQSGIHESQLSGKVNLDKKRSEFKV